MLTPATALGAPLGKDAVPLKLLDAAVQNAVSKPFQARGEGTRRGP
jgi:hypothetical protein